MASTDPPYEFENVGGHAVITLQPALNSVQWADIERIGSELIGRVKTLPNPSVVVDLSRLNYLGSAMVALVVRVWKAVRESNGRMVVVNRDENVYEVLRLAGLVKVWSIVKSREEGLQELGYGRRPASGRRTFLLTAVAVLALAGAALGLYGVLSRSGIMDEQVALSVAFVCAAVGLIVGTVTGILEVGGKRAFGIAVVLLSLGVIVTGALSLPKVRGAEPGPVEHDSEESQRPAAEDSAI